MTPSSAKADVEDVGCPSDLSVPGLEVGVNLTCHAFTVPANHGFPERSEKITLSVMRILPSSLSHDDPIVVPISHDDPIVVPMSGPGGSWKIAPLKERLSHPASTGPSPLCQS